MQDLGRGARMRILIIEDDTRLAGILERALRDEGYTPEIVDNGMAATDALAAGRADMALLDLGLPGRDGLEVLRRLRGDGSSLPVLVLTGRDAVGQRVAGLDAGADDYLVKPFALDELLARVRSLLRRGVGQAAMLRYADIELDPAARVARRAGHTLDLRPLEATLLEMFLRHPEEVLTRTRLYHHVWGEREDLMSNVLEVYVGYLRGHLEAHGPRVVHTERGRGYVLRRGSPT